MWHQFKGSNKDIEGIVDVVLVSWLVILGVFDTLIYSVSIVGFGQVIGGRVI